MANANEEGVDERVAVDGRRDGGDRVQEVVEEVGVRERDDLAPALRQQAARALVRRHHQQRVYHLPKLC